MNRAVRRRRVRHDGRMRLRFAARRLAPLLVAVVMVVAACSADDDPSASPDTTTGTVPRDPTTTTTSTLPGEADLPGLWLVTSTGLYDEEGERWSSLEVDQTLRNPVDDGAGGVYYLRCVDVAPNCAIEHVDSAGGTPAVLGEAQRLLALGTAGGAPLLLTSWQDPAVTPSFEGNVSGLVLRTVDVQSRETSSPVTPWFGWESGPFAADVENDLVAACVGEGETCELFTSDGLDGVRTPVPGVDFSTVMSLVLDAEGTQLTWLVSEPMAGTLSARVLDLESGEIADTPLRAETDDPADESVTDGTWAAVRVGSTVDLVDLVEGTTGQREVPDDVSEMAIRSGGGSSQGPASVL